ncbi:FGGY family carbohydrate kinase, partial [Bacillus sp. WP8]|uniref:FGGY family carbohydrate kinase n=1 Tax=Bacillus sp. WP8 TaxID=756828 RepID=UPI0037BE2FDF
MPSVHITNHPETPVLWHKHTAPPLYNPILSHSRQTSPISQHLKPQPHNQTFTNKTRLLIHPYFSPTKLKSILHNLQPPPHKPQNAHFLFPTIHTSLISNITARQSH